MISNQPHMASTLIQELGALNVAFPSILEDEDARAKALYLVHKLRVALEKPHNEPFRNSALVKFISSSGKSIFTDIYLQTACPVHGRAHCRGNEALRLSSEWLGGEDC